MWGRREKEWGDASQGLTKSIRFCFQRTPHLTTASLMPTRSFSGFAFATHSWCAVRPTSAGHIPIVGQMKALLVVASVAFATTLVQESHAEPARVTFVNQCEYPIKVYDNDSLCPLKPGSRDVPIFGCDRQIPRSTMYRHEKNPEATLAEFTVDNKAWYDISVIPPGPGNCRSFDDCRNFTRKAGFNVPVMILPTRYRDVPSYRCERIMCHWDRCPDAFHFPADTQKVYNCPADEHFQVIYCP